MIQPDGSNGAHAGADKVGGIQPAAHAHLHNGKVHPLPLEHGGRQGRAQLKGRGEAVVLDLQPLGCRYQRLAVADKQLVRQGQAVHPDALLVRLQEG